MKLRIVAVVGFGLTVSGCAYYPTNGNDTSFTRTGTLECPPELQIDPNLLGGTEERPLRCGPQEPAL